LVISESLTNYQLPITKTMETILGLDIGTTSTKAVLFDLTGVEVARGISLPYRTITRQPGWVEQEPEEIWQAVLTAVSQTLSQRDKTITVQAICIAAQSGSLLPADAEGNPVHPLITWLDGRSQTVVQQWKNEGLEAEVKQISGWSLYPGLPLPTIAWLRQHDPDTFAATRRYLSVNDFIVHRLTGQFVSNPSNGGGMQLLDIRTGNWSDELCALAGISAKQLSPIQPAGMVIGNILPEVRRTMGLPDGVVLVNGGHDQGCTALGLGITSPGKMLLACGTAWVFTGVMASPKLGSVPAALDWNFHVAADCYTISQSLGGLGASLEWWLNQAWRGVAGLASRQAMFAALDDELKGVAADSLPPRRSGGRLIFLPLTGGHDDPATTQRGGFVGLQLSHSRADMARAIMESGAFELRWALQPIQQAGLPIEQLWMVGGATRSPHWPQILADVTGIPIRLPAYDNWPALGTAVLAGVAIGAFETVAEGLTHFQKPARDVLPDAAMQGWYDEIFELYKKPQRGVAL
jgi:xylulokinase